MKIQRKHFVRGSEGGSATVIFIALLVIMLILVMANGKSLFLLHNEVNLLEQQQVKRLNASQTNSVAITKSDSK
jgi:archaellum component FlaF (FlaF/FlaG flagellin family)